MNQNKYIYTIQSYDESDLSLATLDSNIAMREFIKLNDTVMNIWENNCIVYSLNKNDELMEDVLLPNSVNKELYELIYPILEKEINAYKEKQEKLRIEKEEWIRQEELKQLTKLKAKYERSV